MIEGSGSRAGSGSGSIPLTNGSGSGRPKNTWIRWIRIRNTAKGAPVRPVKISPVHKLLLMTGPWAEFSVL